MNILYLSTEISPYAVVGGLAQVTAALPRATRALGEDVRVMLPRYGLIPPQQRGLKQVLAHFDVPIGQGVESAALWQAPDPDLPIYFIENQRLFGSRSGIYNFYDDGERFIFYSRAALEAARQLGWRPDILHCNEWQTALIPNWLRTLYRDDPFFARAASVYTIHNLSHHGIFGAHELHLAGLDEQGFLSHPEIPDEQNQALNMMARGIIFADLITASPETSSSDPLAPLLQDRHEHFVRIQHSGQKAAQAYVQLYQRAQNLKL